MFNDKQFGTVERLAQSIGASWPNIATAAKAAATKRQQLTDLFMADQPSYAPADTNIVVFGSLARNELTTKSDLDWTLLVDGEASSDHQHAAHHIRQVLEDRKSEIGLKPPGPTGVFGRVTFSHDLIHYIGGEDDTNTNTTRRILLLLESRPVAGTDPGAYTRTVTGVIDRYLQEQLPKILGRDSLRYKVPRFLLNDVVRFWRTMAVDFASKQWVRGGEGWGLRNAKLQMSRKLIFVSGLLVCFNCHKRVIPEQGITEPRKQLAPLTNFLRAYIQMSPLDVLADTLLANDIDKNISRTLLDCYDAFLGILNDAGKRDELNTMRSEHSRTNATYNEVRDVSRSFQQALINLFFENNAFRDLSKQYAIF